MFITGRPACMCGHDSSLHDAYGCGAFLGAFPETAHIARYCPCTQFTLLPVAQASAGDDETDVAAEG